MVLIFFGTEGYKESLQPKSIAAEDVESYKEWIANRKKLEEAKASMIDFGYRYATELQDLKKSKQGNSKKTMRSTQGGSKT